MIRDGTRLAACIAFAYIIVVLGGVYLHYWQTGDEYTLRYSLSRESTWNAVFIASLLAVGLWLRHQWAWWLGLVAGVLKLVGQLVWIAKHFPPGFGVVLVLALLIAFLATLMLPGTRAACLRSAK
jgi:hypothetical protein